MRSRAEELRLIEEFIKAQDVTVLQPFEEDQARKKWRLKRDEHHPTSKQQGKKREG